MRPYRNLLPNALYGVMELIAPPDDLFEPVLDAPGGAGDVGLNIPRQFAHRYKGLHALGLEAELKIPMPVKTYDWGGRFRVTILQNNTVVLDRTVGDVPSPWWRDKLSGLDLLLYRSPGDVPFWAQLSLQVLPLETTRMTAWPYGKATWYVRRVSEK